MKKYKTIFNEDINNNLDNLVLMLRSGKYDRMTYAAGMEALNDKYDMVNNRDFDVLRKQLMLYSNNVSKRKLLKNMIVSEYYYLTDN